MPILTVVTIHLDEFDELFRTFQSLRSILGTNTVQWIVIDGGSELRDVDSEVLEQLKSLADHFISEPDDGIYDAMNKGTRHAKGEYVLYLNAGDELHPKFSLADLGSELEKNRPEMIWGTCFERFQNRTLVKVKNRSPKLAWYGMPVNHQNVLFRLDTLGREPYRVKYRYLADYDLIGRIMKRGGGVFRTPMPIAIFRRGGVSSRNFVETMKEEEVLRCLHFGVNRKMSCGLRYLKQFNSKVGSIPAVRRLMRRWV